ncbi:hypothetical protein ANS017_33140 [Paraclostridium bifermentans]|uniref:hypothetical protein n=1 Tax=Paraclostridium bifermentans TaxID=1490 RepID=UPI0021C2CDB0|nr:hypothetical protein ANS017_33140 [Paraclostridium bifermentans]
MAESKTIKIHNKSDKPDNIVLRDNRVIEKCIQVENNLPKFMKDYCIYLKGSVSVTTRLAYLEDIQFFCSYLIETKEITIANEIKDITLNEFNQIKARDVNLFLGDYCTRYYKYTDKNTHIYENNNRALARKKSSLSTLFKFLFRNDQLEANITDGFNPIKLPKHTDDY